MPAIDRPGIYKGTVTDFAVSVTSKQKLPQLVLTLQATELYDAKDEVWESWVDYDHVITAYLVLVTLNESGVPAKCFSYDSVVEAVDWDGETFSGLAAMNLKGKVVQFNVVENEYPKGTIQMKVNSIAAEDASIGLKKLDAADLAVLDATFHVSSGKKPKAAKPKKAPKATKAPAAAPKTAPSAPKGVAQVTMPSERLVEPCTETEAYEACTAAASAVTGDAIPKEIVDDYWVKAVTNPAIVKDQENITPMEYGAVKNEVLDDIRIPF